VARVGVVFLFFSLRLEFPSTVSFCTAMTTAALQQDIVCYMCHYTYYHYSPNTLYIIRVSSHLLPSFHVVHASAV
jgi:hypothetical protein